MATPRLYSPYHGYNTTLFQNIYNGLANDSIIYFCFYSQLHPTSIQINLDDNIGHTDTFSVYPNNFGVFTFSYVTNNLPNGLYTITATFSQPGYAQNYSESLEIMINK